jgi:NAD-dependent DNA ligase
VPWYLMASYAYYVEDDPILSDHAYDHMVKKMIKELGKIEHTHKKHLNLDDLKAGTYLGEYPTRIKGAVQSIRRK